MAATWQPLGERFALVIPNQKGPTKMHTDPAVTEAGLLLSLSAQLPDPHSPLCRRAARLAGKLSSGGTSRAVHREAADLLAALLEAADADLTGYDSADLLCSEWDE